MIEQALLYFEEDLGDGTNAVDVAMFGSSTTVADKLSRKTILAGLRSVEKDLELSPRYWTSRKETSSQTSTTTIPGDPLFSLRPQILSADEVVELESFRAKAKRARAQRFPAVPSDD